MFGVFSLHSFYTGLMRLISRKTTTKPESMTDYVIKNWNPDPDLSSVSELLKHCFLFFQKLEDEVWL